MSPYPTDTRDSGHRDGGPSHSPVQETGDSDEAISQDMSNVRLAASSNASRSNTEQRCGCSKCRYLTNHVNDDLLYNSTRVQTCSMNSYPLGQACNTGPGMVSPAHIE